MSAATSDRKVGVAAAPVVGPEKIRFADSVASVPVKVPVDVTGEPLTVKMPGSDKPTLVTAVPVPMTESLPSAFRIVAALLEPELNQRQSLPLAQTFPLVVGVNCMYLPTARCALAVWGVSEANT